MLNAWSIMAIISAIFLYITITFTEFIRMLHIWLSFRVVQETDLFINVAEDTVIVSLKVLYRKFCMRNVFQHLNMERIKY